MKTWKDVVKKYGDINIEDIEKLPKEAQDKITEIYNSELKPVLDKGLEKIDNVFDRFNKFRGKK